MQINLSFGASLVVRPWPRVDHVYPLQRLKHKLLHYVPHRLSHLFWYLLQRVVVVLAPNGVHMPRAGNRPHIIFAEMHEVIDKVKIVASIDLNVGHLIVITFH